MMTATPAKIIAARPFHRKIAILACGLACGLSGLAAMPQSPSTANAAGIAAPAPTFSPLLQAALTRPTTAVPLVAQTDLTTAIPAAATLRPADTYNSSELLRDTPEIPTPTTPFETKSADTFPRYRVMMMEVTAYCPCTKCCGENAQGITASGKPVTHNEGRFVAADTRVLPFNTQLSIPGYYNASPVPVIDRGGAIKGNKLDVYFDSHEDAKQWGRRIIPVRVLAAE